MYHSLCLSYIMYCSEVWGNTYSTNLACLVLSQENVIRLHFLAKKLDHTTELFCKLRILKVVDIMELKYVISII